MTDREPIWVDRAVAIAVHGKLLAEFGGPEGIRDQGLLDSALARPRNLAAYGTANVFDIAAAYACSIVRNHPFVDGNKRTGFVTAFVFLVRNGQEPHMSEAETVAVMRGVAAGTVSQDELAAWFAVNCGASET